MQPARQRNAGSGQGEQSHLLAAHESVARLNRSRGLQLVSSSPSTSLWDRNGVRLRVALLGSTPGFPLTECRLIVPRKPELLPFLFPQQDQPGYVQVLDEQIIRTQMVESSGDYERLLDSLENLAALVQSEDTLRLQQELLLPLPLPDKRPGGLSREASRLLAAYLKQFRVAVVAADMPTLGAYLREIGAANCLEFHPGNLVSGYGDIRRSLDCLAKLSPLSGLVVVLNSDLLRGDERVWQTYCSYLARLNQMPSEAGCRFLLCSAGDALDEDPLPWVGLPDVAKGRVGPLLKDHHLAAAPSNLVAASILSNAGLASGEIAESLRRRDRLASSRSTHGVNRLRFGNPRRRGPRGPEARRHFESLRSEAARVFAERMVGHADIIAELTLRLPLWYLLETEKPLALGLCGPSGCGKNHLLEVVAEILRAFFDLPAAHYCAYNAGMAHDEKHWDLVRVGIGHVGSQKRGLLETLNDGSVFSFDEADKQLGTDSDVQPLLLQILDDGAFRNGHGQLVQLPRCVVAVTMNAGTEPGADARSGLGFGAAMQSAHEATRERYRDFFQKYTLPALRGRLDATYFFSHLGTSELEEIARRELAEVRGQLEALGLPPWTEDDRDLARRLLTEADPLLGARAVRAAVHRFKTHFFGRLSTTASPS